MNWSKGFTVKEKIFLHLLNFTKYTDTDEVPEDVTQQGIADIIYAPRPHVSMALKDLRNNDHVIERTCHITHGKRRQKVYFLSTSGIQLAKVLNDQLMNSRIKVIDKTGENILIFNQGLSKSKFSIFELLDQITPEGVLDLTKTFEKVQKEPPLVVTLEQTKPRLPEVSDKGEQKNQQLGLNILAQDYTGTYSSYPYPYYERPPVPYFSEKIYSIIFSIGFFLMLIGSISGVYIIATGELVALLPFILFLTLGLSIMALSTSALWYNAYWQKLILHLLSISIPIILYISFYAALEPAISYYDLGLWLIIIISFLAFVGLGTFIPLTTRVQLIAALGLIIIINAPLILFFYTPSIFQMGFWVLIGIICTYTGYILLVEYHVEKEVNYLKELAPGLTLGLGIGIITSCILFIYKYDLTKLTGIQVGFYTTILLWFIIALILIFQTFREHGSLAIKSVTSLKSALPIFFGILLLFFSIFLIRFEKIIETVIELFLGGILIIYGIKNLLGKDFFEILLVGLIALSIILSLALILIL